jgi:PncC family amidohydrolase
MLVIVLNLYRRVLFRKNTLNDQNESRFMETEITRLAVRVGELLAARSLTFCAAESCTGGLLLSTLTDISGSSAYVLGGFVTYSNAAKQQFAAVQEATLIAHGAVSEATAREMALGTRAAFGADFAMSLTGIAGPGGGTAEKPVGLVYIGLAHAQGVQVARYVWDGNRVENKRASVQAALEMLLAHLLALPDPANS